MSTTQQRLDAYLDAEARVLAGQSVRLGDRQVTLADLSEIRKGIAQLRSELAAAQVTGPARGSLRYRTAVF